MSTQKQCACGLHWGHTGKHFATPDVPLMVKHWQKFCADCGKEMLIRSVPAEQVEVNHYDSGGGSWWRLADPYDKVNGARNFAEVRQCPDYRRSYFGCGWKHDIFAIFEGKEHYGVRVKK